MNNNTRERTEKEEKKKKKEYTHKRFNLNRDPKIELYIESKAGEKNFSPNAPTALCFSLQQRERKKRIPIFLSPRLEKWKKH